MSKRTSLEYNIKPECDDYWQDIYRESVIEAAEQIISNKNKGQN